MEPQQPSTSSPLRDGRTLADTDRLTVEARTGCSSSSLRHPFETPTSCPCTNDHLSVFVVSAFGRPRRSGGKPKCRAARLASQATPHDGRPVVKRCRGCRSNCPQHDTSKSPKRIRTPEMNEANLVLRPEYHATWGRPTPEGVVHSPFRGTHVSPAARHPKKSCCRQTAAAMSYDPPRAIVQDRPTSHQRTARTGRTGHLRERRRIPAEAEIW